MQPRLTIQRVRLPTYVAKKQILPLVSMAQQGHTADKKTCATTPKA